MSKLQCNSNQNLCVSLYNKSEKSVALGIPWRQNIPLSYIQYSLESYSPVTHEGSQYHQTVFKEGDNFGCFSSLQQQFASRFEFSKREGLCFPFNHNLWQFGLDIFFFHSRDTNILKKIPKIAILNIMQISFGPFIRCTNTSIAHRLSY